MFWLMLSIVIRSFIHALILSQQTCNKYIPALRVCAVGTAENDKMNDPVGIDFTERTV